MKGQPNRLAAEASRHLAGTAIDRSRPLQFGLDGRIIHGFAGDTVLSAVLASGIDTVGLRHDAPLALSARYAPTIIAAALAGDPQQALAMERTPAVAGAEYLTLSGTRRRPIAGWLRRLTRPRASLGLDLDRPYAMRIPWLTSAGIQEQPVDLIVVGGGVAGMSAAVAGAKAGLKVTLLEATPRLGGHARLFGTLEGEETPDESIARLTEAIAKSDAITVWTNAEVFAARAGAVRAHVIETSGGVPSPRVIDLHADHIVIATGSIERLPIFPGNRRPGIVGALEAFELAHHYGVWRGQSALFATTSSPAYRLAMLASDAGIAVARIIDGRPQPQSRFIEFSKAYGITLAASTIVASVRPASKSKGIIVTPQLAMEGLTRAEPDLIGDRLIACGGWQPDLTLWHMAGGESRWNSVAALLEPTSGLSGVALAGSAAGYLSRRACLASGGDAIDLLLGRPRRAVEELTIDPIYETPDGPASVATASEEPAAPSFLDASRRYIERPLATKSRWPAWLPFAPKPAGWSLADTPQPLDVADIAAGVQLGAIPASSAGIVAQERVAMVAIAAAPAAGSEASARPPQPLVPSFLSGRFGNDAQLWVIAPSETRTLEPGALIHRSADDTDPLSAIGVVVRVTTDATIALLAASHTGAGQTAAVREQDRATSVRLIAAYVAGMDLAAALGSGA
jgi:sarcosine oxidase, subunit alpha